MRREVKNADDYLRRKQINMEANGEQVLWTDKQTRKMDKRILLSTIIFIPIYCALSFTKAIIPTLRDISQISGEGAAFAIGVCIFVIISWLFSIFVVFMVLRLMLSTMETVVILTNRRIIEFVM